MLVWLLVQGPPEVMRGDNVREHTLRYSPPMEEFQLERMDIPGSCTTSIPAVPGPAIILAQHGSVSAAAGEQTISIKRGDVVFVPAGIHIELETSEEPARLWVANISGRLLE